MAVALKCTNGKESLRGLVDYVLKFGERVSPRGQATVEVRNVIVTITDPTDPLMLGMGRAQNSALAAVEALQLIAGVQTPALLRRVAPNTARFLDGESFHGSYGVRLRPQLPGIIEKLRADPTTRQAVATIWDPLHDLHVDDSRDYPCTVYLSWAIRNGALHMTSHMRSNDVWWGWTYDLFQFTQLQCTMANVLGIPVGEYTHYVDSMHIYERDFTDIAKLHPAEKRSLQMNGLDALDWRDAKTRARNLLSDPQRFLAEDTPSQTEAFMADAILKKLEKTTS